MPMEELSTLFAGPAEGEAQLFHTPSGIGALLAEILQPKLEEGEFCGTGVVRLRDLESGGADCEAFDQVVLTPTYGRLSGNQWQENRIIRAGLERLRPGGSCICVVSNGWLARRSLDDVETRRMLVEEYALTQLLLLPPHTFGTEVKASVFFLEKIPPRGEGVLITDLRSVGTGYDFLKALCQARPDGVRLTWTQLRARDYMLLPEAYEKPPKSTGSAVTLAELEKKLHRLYQEAEDGGRRFEQFSLFCVEPTPPVRDPEMVRRLIDLEYRRLDCLFQRLCEEQDWPRRPGRSLFALRNGLEYREETRGEGYPLFTAAGFSGFARAANVTEVIPNLAISRVGAYCGQVYRVWEKCLVSANAMYLTQVKADLPLDLLLLLLRSAGLNRLKRGSAQPYITQDVILDWEYPVPPPAETKALLERFDSDLARIHGLEVELITGNRR